MSDFEFPLLMPNRYSGFFEIISVARYLPSTEKTTRQLLDEYGSGLNETIIKKSLGVESRAIADSDHCDSDLLAYAGRECLKRAGVSVDDLSKIMVNKLLGDRILPPTASLLQKKLGASVAVQCMDIDGGSNGFMQALQMAGRCIDGGDELVLIVSGGVHHKLMDQKDPRCAFLFGDAAAAVLLRSSRRRHLLSAYEFSDYRYSGLHHAVDFYQFVDEFLSDGTLNLFKMGNWKEAENTYRESALHTAELLLHHAETSMDAIDWFLVSQPNLPLWNSVLEYLAIPESKTLSVFEYSGNTLAANLPLQLYELKERADLKGKMVMMLSLGEGILGGGCIYQF